MYTVYKEYNQLSQPLKTMKEVKQWFKEKRSATGSDLELTKSFTVRGYTATVFGSFKYDIIKTN